MKISARHQETSWLTLQMNAIMEVDKRDIKIKRHEKEKSNNKRIRPTSFNVTGVSKFFLPEKRARRNTRIPKFLLGGNISDPLNLNSLQVRSRKLHIRTRLVTIWCLFLFLERVGDHQRRRSDGKWRGQREQGGVDNPAEHQRSSQPFIAR